jgi:histidinol-phosphate phosphatase family protein
MTRGAIVAGGRATRMGALCAQVPKALLPIGDVPLLLHQLRLLGSAGVREVTILTGHQGDAIEAFLRTACPADLRVEILREKEPLGSGGCLLAARRDSRLAVLLGDVMINMALSEMLDAHAASGASATMVVHPNDHPQDSDLVGCDVKGRVVQLLRRPRAPELLARNLVSAGAFVFEPSFWQAASGTTPLDLVHDLIGSAIETGRHVQAYSTCEYLKDLGTRARYEAVLADERSGRIRRAHRSHRRAAAFLDRDGTLNRAVGHVRRPDQLELCAGAAAAVRQLNQAGVLVVVVTNQPVLARGECDERALAAIHARLETVLAEEGAYLDAIYVCPHHPDGGYPGEVGELKIPCPCRKPEPGMIETAVRELPVDLSRSAVFGDSWRDRALAERVGIPAYVVTDNTPLEAAVTSWLSAEAATCSS